MRIGIDANPMVGDRGGVGWHTYNLVRAMLAAQEDVDLVAYLRPGSSPPDETRTWRGIERLHWVTASKWAMRGRGASDRLDLYHGTNFRMHTVGRCGGVVTVHDLWLERFPQYSNKFLGQWLSSWKTKRTAWKAKRVVTVSQFSAGELTDLYGIPRERISVVYNGVANELRPRHDAAAMEALRRRIGLPDRPFVLFVGGADPRKNHRGFLHAAALVRKELEGRTLLLVGSPMHPFGSYRDTAQSVGLLDQICCPGRMSMEDLQLLYSAAGLFVFPSLYEGFGMPVLEAMACGAPVITSDGTSLKEVAGDAAVLVDPANPGAIGDAMVNVLRDAALREQLRAKGFERAKQFTWERAAADTLRVYREVCGAA